MTYEVHWFLNLIAMFSIVLSFNCYETSLDYVSVFYSEFLLMTVVAVVEVFTDS